MYLWVESITLVPLALLTKYLISPETEILK